MKKLIIGIIFAVTGNALLAVPHAVQAADAAALEFTVEKDIPYYSEEALAREGDYARNRCKLDVRVPVGVTNFATVVNLHGGGLVKGNKGFAPWPAEAREHDPVAGVAVGYRLLTNATPEQCISDAAAAVAWTVKNIAKYGGDPKKVFVTGVSGGGYLTAMVGLDPKWLAPHGLKPTDLCGIAPFTGQMTKHFNVRKVGFKDDDPQFVPKIDEWAPLAWATADAPPACFLTGGRDVEWKARVEENALLEASMRALGNRRVEFHETEGDHGGGVKPSSYFFRNFVLKTCNTSAVGGFSPGERIVFLGDSITHGGKYVGYLQLFAALRHPGWNVRCINAGISGDTAGGGLGRVSWDVKVLKPDRVFAMFGMNDVGRDNYATTTPDEKTQAARAKALDRYAQNVCALADAIPAIGAQAVLVTPSPYDQYATRTNGQNLVACNDPGLAACAAAVREAAAARNLGVAELHRPLTEILQEHPDLGLGGPDRVHPREEGHLLMAALVLESMHVPALVARASVDAQTFKAEKIRAGLTENAVVSDVRRTGDGVAFTYAPKSLPFPALPEYLADDKIYPLTEKLNREEIVVRHLKPGRYALMFDGVKLGSYTARELAKGVNVAILPTANQMRAQETATLVKELVANESVRRNLALNYVRFRHAKIALDDFAAQDAYLDKVLAKMEAQKSPWHRAHVGITDTYRKNRTRAAELNDRAADLFARINAVRPAVCRVRVVREGDE